MSTFTDWNGPLSRGPAPNDWRTLIAEWKDIVEGFNDKLSDYALKKDITDADYASKSYVTNMGYLKADALANYATHEWVNQQGFLKEHQTVVSSVDSGVTSPVSSGAVYSYVNDNFATKSALNDKMNTFIWSDTMTDTTTLPVKAGAIRSWVTSKNYLSTDSQTWSDIKDGFTKHKASHDSDSDDNLVLVNDLILADGKAIKSGSLDLLKLSPVPSGNDLDGVYNAKVLLIGDSATNNAIPASTQRFAFLDNGVLKFYPLQDEIGTVPVGGIIEWPISWEDYRGSSSRDDLLKYLKLDQYSGEWQPCDGAVVPYDETDAPEYKEIYDLLANNDHHFPTRMGHIIHAKAASDTTAEKSNIYAMGVATLSTELQKRLEDAEKLVKKYEAIVATQDALIENNRNIIDTHIETPLPDVHSGDQFKRGIMSGIDSTYASKTALRSESVRAQSVETILNDNITKNNEAIYKELVKKASVSGLNAETAARVAADNSLTEVITQEHIGAHNAIKKLDSRVTEVTQQAERAKNIAVGTENKLNVERNERKAADSLLSEQLETNRQAVQDVAKNASDADNALMENIVKEHIGAHDAIKKLDSRITGTTRLAERTRTMLSTERSERQAADSSLSNQLETNRQAVQDVAKNASDADQAIRENIAEVSSQLENKITAEADRAESAEQELSEKIGTETTRAESAEQELSDKIDTETTRAESAEHGLSEKIDTETEELTTLINTESDSRREADDELTERIDETNQNLTEEIESRIVDDQLLEDKVDQINKQSTVLFIGEEADLPASTPAEDGTVIADGQTVFLKTGTVLSAYKAAVDEDSNVTWEIVE